MTKIVKEKVRIEGMHCTSCAVLIDGDLEDLPGVKSAKTSYAKSETEIEFDESQLNLNQVISVIKKTGYNAKFPKENDQNSR